MKNETKKNLKKHVPNFRWVIADDGEKWIYDGNFAVGALFEGCDRKQHPYKPICFHDLKLIPGGTDFIGRGELAGPLGISWRKHLICRMEIDDIQVEGDNSENLKLYFSMHDRPDQLEEGKLLSLQKAGYCLDGCEEGFRMREETWIEVSYDSELCSYIFDVVSQLTPFKGKEEIVKNLDLCGLEFADILPHGCNDKFPPHGNKRYPYVIYKDESGEIYKNPQNHQLGPGKLDLLYAQDGFLVFGPESGYNPIIEFLDNCGNDICSIVCWAMYDIHFKLKPERVNALIDAGKPLRVHYKIYTIDKIEAEKLLGESKLDPKFDNPMARCPVFYSGQQNKFKFSEEYKKPSDKWFWQMSDPCCIWDLKIGFKEQGSLSIIRKSAREKPFQNPLGHISGPFRTNGENRSQWELHALGSGKPQLLKNRQYLIKAKVKTTKVEGKVFIAWAYRNTSTGTGDYIEKSKSISGNTDWTEISLTTSQNKGANWASLYLAFEGKGQCWFDEVEIIPL